MGTKINKTKAPVSLRAVMARVNRKLAKEDEMLRRCRSDSRGWHELGDFYVVDVSRNCITDKQVDLEALAREMDVLAKWEQVEAGPS
jgi:hypothetical protein